MVHLLCCICCKKREEAEELRLNCYEDDGTLRVACGGTQLMSGEWYSAAIDRRVPVLPGSGATCRQKQQRLADSINSPDFQCTQLRSGRAVAERQRALATPKNIFGLPARDERPPSSGYACRKEPETQWFREHRDRNWKSVRLASDSSFTNKMHHCLDQRMQRRVLLKTVPDQTRESTDLQIGQKLEAICSRPLTNGADANKENTSLGINKPAQRTATTSVVTSPDPRPPPAKHLAASATAHNPQPPKE